MITSFARCIVTGACAVVFSCTLDLLPSAAQTLAPTGSAIADSQPTMENGILIARTVSQIEAAWENKSTLTVFALPETFEAERALLEKVAKDNTDLLVIYVDPETVTAVDQMVAGLVQGPIVYPTHVFIGALVENRQVILPFHGKPTPEFMVKELAYMRAWRPSQHANP